jgi:hexosaminidase
MYLHLGADEVEKQCWSLEPTIHEFMRKMGFQNNSQGYEKLQAYFFNRVEPMYRNIRKRAIIWDELLLSQSEYKLPQDSKY